MSLKDSIFVYKVKSPVYLRESFSVNSKAITTLETNNDIELIDSTGNWYQVRVKETNLVGYVGKSFLEKDESMPLNLGSIALIIFLFLVINWIRKKVFRKRSRSSAKTKTNNDHPRPKKSTWGYFTSYSYESVKSVTSLERGTASELHLVKLLLKSGVPKETIFHDLYFSKGGGEFSQIDLVLATTEGIIVFEVKDSNGWIYGNSNYTNWKQTYRNGKKYSFYNPIKQNKGHISSLKKSLDQFNRVPFFSIVVFYGSCEIKEIDYVPKNTFIVKPHRIPEVLKLIKESNPPANYSNKQEVVSVLKRAVENGSDPRVKEQHVKNIKDKTGKGRIFH